MTPAQDNAEQQGRLGKVFTHAVLIHLVCNPDLRDAYDRALTEEDRDTLTHHFNIQNDNGQLTPRQYVRQAEIFAAALSVAGLDNAALARLVPGEFKKTPLCRAIADEAPLLATLCRPHLRLLQGGKA